MYQKMTVAALGLLTMFAGCSEPSTTVSHDDSSAVAPHVVATSEPSGAVPVGQARESVEDGEEVVLVGVVGGSSQPFVDGLAAFTIVDPKVPYCAPEEGCATPWDYCCEQDQVKDNIATVKVVDESGNPVATDARELLEVEELSTVVVKGAAERDEQGNLAVLANQVFIRPGE
ncbi:hypothetical protein [Candidatus Laterigemmans baculatus]|uniref:hypothetical protein n=1 Tax=Candidatus Laterigemmans baculatus TaxID=2770505 RepID=UPI001F17790C|nr:hypothetical protein [Candidatus Laterigemmans baculatus]